ncbi:MAG TPA: serine hydrolase domain-containing protein [Acidimicrobiales bacterium]|jgi:CubicO group peptidase (beta-lactamase class C family)
MDEPFGGSIEPGFEAVGDAFKTNFEKGRERGAAFCLHVDGRKVVDIYGGYADRARSIPYDQDALQLVFSSTKGATAICANLLEQRGQLDLSAPVANYWPEFAQAGKENIPVLWLLSHQAGLPVVDRDLSPEEAQAWDPMIEALAAQAPVWEPGTAHGYHALTYGYLVGEVVRRITGTSLGTFFAEQVAGPLGLEFWIGLPEAQEHRVSPIGGGAGSLLPEGSDGPPSGLSFGKTLLGRALNAARAFSEPGWMNTVAWHAAEVPAGNGITNARSLSRLYAALISPVEGGPPESFFTPEQVERARTQRTSGVDQVFLSVGYPMEQRIGQGFWLANEYAAWGGAGSFGHAGAGGSYGFADPENKVAVGYVMNKMGADIAGDPRSHRLVKAVYDSIGAEPKYF